MQRARLGDGAGPFTPLGLNHGWMHFWKVVDAIVLVLQVDIRCPCAGADGLDAFMGVVSSPVLLLCPSSQYRYASSSLVPCFRSALERESPCPNSMPRSR